MRCPACTAELETVTAGDIQLDLCKKGCGGVWFDQDELLKFDEQHEFPTHEILSIAKEKEGIKVDSSKIKKCPKCPDEVMARQFLDVKHEVEMDQCWNCSGIWLDVGEVNTLRGQYKNIQERSQAVNDYVESKLAETKALLEAHTAQQLEVYNEKTANRFRAGLFAFKQLLGLDDPYDGL